MTPIRSIAVLATLIALISTSALQMPQAEALQVTQATLVKSASSKDAARVKSILKKLNSIKSAKKGKAAWKALSAKDSRLVKRELTLKSKKHLFKLGTSSTNSLQPSVAKTKACWSQGLSIEYFGGVTKTHYFTTTQVTEVCVSERSVKSVEVTDASQEVFAFRPFLRENWFTTGKMNVGWEGRGIVRAVYTAGWAGYDVWQTTACVQLRLNADLVNVGASASCSIG